MTQIVEDLRRGHLFAGLSPEQQERIAKRACRVSLEAGESLFEQGERAERFYLVLRGQIKLYRLSPAGNEKVVEIVSAGSTFAEALMFLDRPQYPVGAQALQRSEVLSIDSADFADMLRGSIDTCFLLMGDMSQRLRGLIREIDNLSLHSATCRVAGYVISIAPADSDEFELGVPKQIVASRLSIKPETFSRIVKNLAEQGLMEISGTRVTISDRERLQKIADVCALPQDSLTDTFLYPCPPARAG
jgi:CRP-like cAMP-binding protein